MMETRFEKLYEKIDLTLLNRYVPHRRVYESVKANIRCTNTCLSFDNFSKLSNVEFFIFDFLFVLFLSLAEFDLGIAMR